MFDITSKPAPRKAPIKVTIASAIRRWGAESIISILASLDSEGKFMVGLRDYQLILEMEIVG